MRMLPTFVERQLRHTFLLPLLLAALIGYSGLFHIEERLSERDYSSIPSAETRVAYCMMTSLSSYERHVLAQSAARPPFSTDSFSRVVSLAHAGEVTSQKIGAIQALRERDDLQRRAAQLALHVADKCGYAGIAWPADQTPLNFMMRWLRFDGSYLFFLAREKQSSPDHAELIYRAALGPDIKSGITKMLGNGDDKGISKRVFASGGLTQAE